MTASRKLSYARVFPRATPRQGEPAIVMLFMGNNEGTRRIYSAWSRDGITFEARRKPLISPPPGTEVTQVEGFGIFPFRGKKSRSISWR